MSPLRRWMVEHGRPSWYSWIVVVLVPIMASMAVLVINLRVNQRAVERERAARVASQQALCEVWVLLDDIYRRTPPATKAGRELAAVVARLRISDNCPPRKDQP